MEVLLLYFAWVREKTGCGEETLLLPDHIHTVRDLLEWQKQRTPEYGEAFAQSDTIRVAIDQQHAALDSSLEGATEIAFFPPVTGG